MVVALGMGVLTRKNDANNLVELVLLVDQCENDNATNRLLDRPHLGSLYCVCGALWQDGTGQ